MDAFKWVLFVLEYLVARSALTSDPLSPLSPQSQSLVQGSQVLKQAQQVLLAVRPRPQQYTHWSHVKPACSR